jgi:transposase
MQYLGIDWGTRRASWCALDEHGALQEGAIPADENGLSRLVLTLGEEVCGCIEMMSGAVWVREQLALAGWDIRIADARKVKAIAPLACKTDRVDARVLADLARRDLIPEVWVPSLEERANRERLRRRAHLIRLRTSAMNRSFGLLTQWGLRRNLTALRQPGAIDELGDLGVPAVWRQSLVTLLGVIDDLDAQLAPLERELRPVARADERVKLLMTIPGVAELLGLTLACEIGDISRFGSAGKLVGYSGLTPTIKQSGHSTRTGGSRKPAPTRCAGPPSRPPNRHGAPRTRGMTSTPTSSSATARPTPPRPPSPPRSSSPPGTSWPAKSPSSPRPRSPREPHYSCPGKLLHSSGP